MSDDDRVWMTKRQSDELLALIRMLADALSVEVDSCDLRSQKLGESRPEHHDRCLELIAKAKAVAA